MSNDQSSSRQGSLPSPRDIFPRSPSFETDTHYELTARDKKNILEVFQLFDLDKDGFLDIFQLHYSLRALGLPVCKKELLSYIRHFTPDAPIGRELISKEDFIMLMRNKLMSRDPESELKRAFNHFDTEGTGKITVTSLKKIANELGQDMSEEELKLMIDEFDLNEDNAIDYEEFKRIMLTTEQRN
ncbi:Centrin-3 [Entomophthora muscae]|uniref:Centrin-3 n=1 Tax=Entomophthora muscae TaxID=34485 RepID=A0ACC2TR98_9FUNG|nr:Centrin-3 [Entomophthora muscae]